MDVPEELIKEVFAHFGAAYYHTEVLHRGLCNIYALMTFERKEDVTRPRVEEKLSRAYSLTLGELKEAIRTLLPEDLQQRLEDALKKRNYLAHHFWFERVHLMLNVQGLLKMQEELAELTFLFNTLDEDIAGYFSAKRQSLGVTNEIIQKSLDEFMEGNLEKPLISQRSLRKRELIVRAWNVETNNSLASQIFETDDGCLWQLCDIGLGWTHFKKLGSDWVVNEIIQKYLPAHVNPRPSISESWNYEFKLTEGAVLWVKRGKREQSYTWGVKSLGKKIV